MNKFHVLGISIIMLGVLEMWLAYLGFNGDIARLIIGAIFFLTGLAFGKKLPVSLKGISNIASDDTSQQTLSDRP